MPFYDLNIVHTANDADLNHTLAFLKELDYNIVALAIDIVGKLPAQLLQLPLEALNVPASLRVLTRCTLTVADNAQNHRINTLNTTYDLLALRPVDDKTFQLCCSSLECDLISLDFTQRLPFVLKFKTVASALQRGIRFEICYSPGITGANDARRNLISGAASLIRATRGRGIILSSEAKSALGLRAPWDVINLAQVWGLSQEHGKEAICEEAAKVVRLAGIKRSSFRGVVDIIDDGTTERTISSDIQTTDPSTAASALFLPQSLPQVTVVPSKTPNPEKAKRKASTMSLNKEEEPVSQIPSKSQKDDLKPLSKREQKRRAKKARLEKAAGHDDEYQSSDTTKATVKSNGFPIQHQALSAKKKG